MRLRNGGELPAGLLQPIGRVKGRRAQPVRGAHLSHRRARGPDALYGTGRVVLQRRVERSCGGLQEPSHERFRLFPLLHFDSELFPARSCQRIEFDLSIGFR